MMSKLKADLDHELVSVKAQNNKSSAHQVDQIKMQIKHHEEQMKCVMFLLMQCQIGLENCTESLNNSEPIIIHSNNNNENDGDNESQNNKDSNRNENVPSEFDNADDNDYDDVVNSKKKLSFSSKHSSDSNLNIKSESSLIDIDNHKNRENHSLP
jgi:hypothetical protein